MSKRNIWGKRARGLGTMDPVGPRRRIRWRGKGGTMRRGRGYQRTGGFYGRFAPLGTELKFWDFGTTDAIIASGAQINNASVNLIPQGVTESTRVGRKCCIKKIGWKFIVYLPQQTAAVSGSDNVRIMLYLDKQCNGETAVLTDILETASIYSFNNLANSGRFRILMDRTYALNSSAGGGDGVSEDYAKHTIVDSFYKNVNIPLEFSGVTGAITELRSNNIGVITSGGYGLGSLNGTMRIRFSDK